MSLVILLPVLADEYYTSSTGYDEFYKPSLEPVEPNVTALLDPENIKWKKLIVEDIEIPTPGTKKNLIILIMRWQELRREMNDKTAKLKRENASKELIEQAEKEYVLKDKKRSEEVDEFLENEKNYGKVGAFEGAGYMPKGMYRPMIDCIMFSKGDKPFCKVCESAIAKVINHYTE